MKTGFAAAKLAIAAFIVPYIFVLAPELLMIDATPFTITFAVQRRLSACGAYLSP